MHPEWQQLRQAWGIAFTGDRSDPKAELCPAEKARPLETIEAWPGNRSEPVDRSQRVTLSGRPAEQDSDGAPAPIDPDTGMHKDYWVLSAEERAKGWVRPYRNSYVHAKCGVVTKMGTALSETYARDPKFYGATFCVGCKTHFPVDQFTWDGTSEIVGS
jgi:hypothetical protein